MPHRLIDSDRDFCAGYEVLREEPLPPYERDPFFDDLLIWQRIGQLIAEAMDPSLKRRY